SISKFASQSARELWQSTFCHPVAKGAETASQAGNRAEQNNGSLTLFCHVRRGSPSQVKHRVHMNGEGIHPTFIRDLAKTAGNGSSGRVHQHIQPSKLLDDLIYSTAARRWFRYVSFEKTDITGREQFRLARYATSRNTYDTSASAR